MRGGFKVVSPPTHRDDVRLGSPVFVLEKDLALAAHRLADAATTRSPPTGSAPSTCAWTPSPT